MLEKARNLGIEVLMAAALSGCMTKEMKSTPFYEGTQVRYNGEARDRVNLWPVAYWRDPVGSVAWPLFSFSDDLFAIRPLYSQYRQDGVTGAYDEFNFLWPIAQADVKNKDYRVFPVFWGESHLAGQGYQAVFPVYWNGPDYNALYPLWIYRAYDDRWSFHTLGGLAGAGRDEDGCRSSWCFPLWYENSRGVFATALFGRSPEAGWCFPFWYKDKDCFITLPYSRGRKGGNPDDTWWASPGLLSWGGTDRGLYGTDHEGFFFLGLAGWNWNDYGNGAEWRKSHSWWAWPFGGHSERTRSSSSWLLSGLVGWERENGSLDECYAFPFFGWERDDSFLTVLGGWTRHEIWLTPLVGINRASSKYEGGWVFPIWSHGRTRGFDENWAKLDSPTLPENIAVDIEVTTNKEGVVSQRLIGRGPYCLDETTWLLLSDNNRSFDVFGRDYSGSETNSCRVLFRHKVGNKLMLNCNFRREIRYDLKTKAKISDEEESEVSFLVSLYCCERNADRMKGETYARHRVLWKLWDWEEQDGAVALDVFPGFTYDRQKDGATRTSFLWRLFRYECDPQRGKTLDLLFMPVWHRGIMVENASLPLPKSGFF